MSKDGQVAKAKKDLARAQKVDESQIAVKSVSSTQWNDASLGLKKGDSSFAMIMIDGYIIDLETGGRTYRYHADEDSRVVRAW
ncbi:MAG TPA: hypothetical protein VIJ28_04770 [Chloroflexota bacterium]|jgi:hypothetical protein